MGIAGRIARTFLQSKLTPLITIASLATGMLAMMATPREEEPQISVPMIDVIAALPGAGAREVENLLARPLERRMWEIPGVDHVYAMSGDGQAMVTVRFKVGEDQEHSIVKVQAKLASAMDQNPAGMSPPLVKAHSIDDVPILALTLHSEHYGSDQLREIAVHLEDEIRTSPVSRRPWSSAECRASSGCGWIPRGLMAHAVSPGEVAQAIRASDARFVAGEFSQRDTVVNRGRRGCETRHEGDLEKLVVAARRGPQRRLRPMWPGGRRLGRSDRIVTHATILPRGGCLGGDDRPSPSARRQRHRGAEAALERMEAARERLLPADVEIEVTRNYGETAGGKGQRTDPAHPDRDVFRHAPDLVLPGLARSGGGPGGGAGHASVDTFRLLCHGVLAQSHHAVRAHLLHRHPGGRRDRRGGEHLPAHGDRASARRKMRPSRASTRWATRPSSRPSR